MQFNDTAYLLSDEFSPYYHDHDDKYNLLSLEFSYPNGKDDSSMLSLGNVFFDGSLIPIYAPISTMTQIWKIPFSISEPKVGMLKLVANSSISSNSMIAYKNEDFDGWLYPDGSTFNLTDFMLSTDLQALFGTGDGKTFQLPDVRTFLKMNGQSTKYSGSMIASMPKKNVLYKHPHDVTIYADVKAQIGLVVPVNYVAGNGGRLHGGTGRIRIYQPDKIAKKFDITIDGKQTTLEQYMKSTFDNNWYKDKNISIFENALKAIDKENEAKLANGKHLYDSYAENNILTLNQIPSISVDMTMSLGSNIGIQYEGNDNDETYPTHVIMPVMIYVGQKRRTLQ